MLSVFKFPVALAVLDRAVREGIPLSTPVAVGPEWLDSGTYSPMRDSLPPQGGTLPLGRLLAYAVSQSDNIACDRLIDFAGGPGAVDGYLKRLGITEIRITATERTMHLATENQRFNTARPSALCSLFDRFLQGELLQDKGLVALEFGIHILVLVDNHLGDLAGEALGHSQLHSIAHRTADQTT